MVDLIPMHYSEGRVGEIKHEWQDYASCAETDPDLFFPESGDWRSVVAAREICASCPVVAECAELGSHYADGVFGGMTPRERGTRT